MPLGEYEEQALMNVGLGHRWSMNGLGGRFPAVCVRCMMRSDNPGAIDPCDAVVEKMREREVAR